MSTSDLDSTSSLRDEDEYAEGILKKLSGDAPEDDEADEDDEDDDEDGADEDEDVVAGGVGA
jgi:hypothetical protein